jgi:hypothetical protein
MIKLTDHQKDMISALSKIPAGEVFYVRRTREEGYPHSDAAKVLQQDAILLNYVTYADPSYDNKGIRYMIRKDANA